MLSEPSVSSAVLAENCLVERAEPGAVRNDDLARAAVADDEIGVLHQGADAADGDEALRSEQLADDKVGVGRRFVRRDWCE